MKPRDVSYQIGGRKAKKRQRHPRASAIEIGTMSSSRLVHQGISVLSHRMGIREAIGRDPQLAAIPSSRCCVRGSVSRVVTQNRRRPVSNSANRRMI